jgi:hypothetical protein
MGEFTDLSEACIYAILGRRANTTDYRLFVVKMSPSPSAPQHCLLTKVFDNLLVHEKPRSAKALPTGTALSLKEVFKNIFR